MSRRTSQQPSSLGAVALLVVAMTSVQIGAALAKGMFAAVGPLGAVALRVSFAAVLLAAVLRPWRVRRTAEAWRSVLLYGVALGGMNGLFYVALRTVPLGVATALEFTGPLAVAIVASRRAADFLWVALAVAGLLALLPLGASAGIDPVGAACALAAGVCWALYILFGRKAGAEHGLETTAVGMAIAAVLVLPAGVAGAGAALLSPAILPTALAVAVLSSALPYTLEMYALPRLPAKTFGTLMSVEPALGALAGLALLGEQLTARQWLGLGAIVATSIGTTVTAAQARGPTPQSADPTVGDFASDVVSEVAPDITPHITARALVPPTDAPA
jgi:inner membrane transporter RhtA